jgi:SrtB family sortase
MDEDTALLTTVTAENGAFAFEDIPFGHWVIHEIAAPEGYTVSPEYHHIYIGVDGQVIEIRIDDTLIRGGVQLMKTEAVGEAEAGNPFMRRLSGAVFELYADTDGNKEFDEAADTLLCELDEQDAGLHEKRGLLYGGYFVKEKTAPEGYTSDDKAYYFEIAKDGDMAIIENAGAGQGFVNKPITGGLRIVKDSSDGRRDGFAFEVKATDGTYREVFTTDGSGVIEIGKLRIGTYTVTEVENRASRAYIVPDGVTAEIVSGRTAEVKFFNEKKVVPEPLTTETGGGKPVPQTSDDARVYLLAATLAAASILGALAAFCFARQRKRAAGHPAMRRNLYIAAVVVCMAAVGASALLLASALGEYGKGADAYEKIAAAAHDPAPADADGSDAVDFTVLSDLAPYAVAWITSSGTAIDYPVMEAEDNGYYLRHLPDGSESTVGSLFIDYENDAGFTDRNTVIYGHNMTDGSMFASLNEYRDQAYFDAHPVMRLITLEQAYRLELFSAFEASPGESGTDTSPWALDWTSGQGFEAWLTAMKDRSLVSCGITPMATDRIVTLSTCTDGGRTRFIVMGRLVSIR